MSFDFRTMLDRIRHARGKRKKHVCTKKFFDVLRQATIDRPSFNVPAAAIQISNCDDDYSQELLDTFAPASISNKSLVAKYVNGNGNCLFNAVSVTLIGKSIE